ncbi:MAG: LON peptidase substrate-binding domain-containing protein [Rhizobiaceae bacterium]|nr:LON peptidase substrate-binding domain-containing protein [Rhizobiaceae bacterium]
MQVGNAHYRTAADFPKLVPIFPLNGALLLPGGRLPLNIFEPRYLQMIDFALSADRLIGMIQPALDGSLRPDGEPELCSVGCLGRLVSLSESGDGRYLVALHGICRFRVVEEELVRTPFRQCAIAPFLTDLKEDEGAENVDRPALLTTLRAFLDANELQADWDGINNAGNQTLVNALSMMAPYGPAEKQALLEAPDLKTRAETLVAITEIALARGNDEFGTNLQ